MSQDPSGRANHPGRFNNRASIDP